MINPYNGLTKLSPYDRICTYICNKLSNNSYENFQSSYLTADKIIAKYPDMKLKTINHKVIFCEDVLRYLNDEGFKVITLIADNGFERRI